MGGIKKIRRMDRRDSREGRTNTNKQIRSERAIAEKIELKTKAWKQLKKCKDEEYIKILRKRYNNCKNVLNKARKRLRKEHKRKVIREIESLNTRYPGEYWRLF